MKRLLSLLVIIPAALLSSSCSKDYITPEELFKDSSKVAVTSIHTKGDMFEDTVAEFHQVAVYRKSDYEGKSWLCAWSGGRMVYDMFMLSLYFNDIDKMTVGDKLNPSRTMFSFVASSDSNATTYTYKGKITLASKGEDYVILHFNKVTFNCSFGEYVTDGYLYCPLYDKYEMTLP